MATYSAAKKSINPLSSRRTKIRYLAIKKVISPLNKKVTIFYNSKRISAPLVTVSKSGNGVGITSDEFPTVYGYL